MAVKALLTAMIAGMALIGAAHAETDWKAVGEALGKQGSQMPSGVYRVGLPRSDLKVHLDGIELKPAFALGSWLAFRPMGSEVTVMGDLVLTQAELNPVMKKLSDDGISITAIHNHLLRADPPTFYMHVAAHGDPVRIASALHDGLALSKTPFAAPGSSASPALDLDEKEFERVIGYPGKVNGGVLQFSIARADPVTESGMDVPEAMGSAEAINIQPTGSGRAVATGDFVLVASEVNPVLAALRSNGIEVTALHNHMLDEQPRLFFMHFWANDDAKAIASGLRKALDAVHVAKGDQQNP